MARPRSVPRLAVLVALAGLCACGVSPAPAPAVPVLTILPEPFPGGQTYPVAVSDDGTVIVGNATTPPRTLPQARAFRWTAAGGMTLLALPPGMDTAAVLSTSHDGRYAVGIAVDVVNQRSQAWLWSEARGTVGIPPPAVDLTGAGPVDTEAYDVSDDGVVLGQFAFDRGDGSVWQEPFVWSEALGYGGYPLSIWGGDTAIQTWNPVAISADGRTLVMNRWMAHPGATDVQGAWVLSFGLAFADPDGGLLLYPTGAPDVPALYAEPHGLAESTLAMVGESPILDGQGRGWASPTFWSSPTGQRQVAFGVIGYFFALSPDGAWAGGGNLEAQSAFIWNPSLGLMSLGAYVDRLDTRYGTTIADEFAAANYPSQITGITPAGKRMVGTVGTTMFGNPCRGFVLDQP